jgi:hypothetical protein
MFYWYIFFLRIMFYWYMLTTNNFVSILAIMPQNHPILQIQEGGEEAGRGDAKAQAQAEALVAVLQMLLVLKITWVT